MILTDRSLACRLERAEAVANARFVEARAHISPNCGAEWIEVAGAYAMFDGPESPCTQVFGLGLFDVPTAADVDQIEGFFKDRNAPVFLEVSPLADKSMLSILRDRGYRPFEWSNVMFLPLESRVPENAAAGSLQARLVGRNEAAVWARTAAEGWSDSVEMTGLFDLMMVVSAREDIALFIAELDAKPVGAGALSAHEGVALMAGASTISEFRGRGAQRVLFESRIAYAKQVGCDLAMVCVEPGSASHRNAERRGFRVAYTRIKWKLGGD